MNHACEKKTNMTLWTEFAKPNLSIFFYQNCTYLMSGNLDDQLFNYFLHICVQKCILLLQIATWIELCLTWLFSYKLNLHLGQQMSGQSCMESLMTAGWRDSSKPLEKYSGVLNLELWASQDTAMAARPICWVFHACFNYFFASLTLEMKIISFQTTLAFC